MLTAAVRATLRNTACNFCGSNIRFSACVRRRRVYGCDCTAQHVASWLLSACGDDMRFQPAMTPGALHAGAERAGLCAALNPQAPATTRCRYACVFRPCRTNYSRDVAL